MQILLIVTYVIGNCCTGELCPLASDMEPQDIVYCFKERKQFLVM